MDDETLRQLVRRYAAAWAASDRAEWLSTFATSATQEDPVGGRVRQGHAEIGAFWDDAMASYDGIEIRERAIHVTGAEAALEWTIVAADGPEWVVFDGVDVFTFDNEPLISSVRAYWERGTRRRARERPQRSGGI